MNVDDVNLEKGSGDSNEDVILNFIDDVSNMVVWFNVTNNNITYNSGKGKLDNILQLKVEKIGRGSRIGAQLFSYLDRLIDSVFTKSDCTSSSKDNKKCNIEEVMKKLYSINEINLSDDFIFSLLSYFV